MGEVPKNRYLCTAKKINPMFTVLAQAQSASGAAALLQYLPLIGIVVVMYFFMIRPQQKKAKDQKKFIEEIKVGDRVVTIGGAHGRIAEMEDDTFVLEVERGGRIRFNKSSISLEASKALNAKK
jgi:preprotein translocase subunit YajC